MASMRHCGSINRADRAVTEVEELVPPRLAPPGPGPGWIARPEAWRCGRWPTSSTRRPTSWCRSAIRETHLGEAETARRAAAHHLPAAALRRRRGRRRLPRRPDRPRRPRLADGRPASRPAAAPAADRPGPGVRRQQLPVRLQRRRRRHGLGAGGRMPGRAQGPPGPPRAVGGDGGGRPAGAGRRRGTGRRASASSSEPTPGWRRCAHRRSRRRRSPAPPPAAGRCSTSRARGPNRSPSTVSWAA